MRPARLLFVCTSASARLRFCGCVRGGCRPSTPGGIIGRPGIPGDGRETCEYRPRGRGRAGSRHPQGRGLDREDLVAQVLKAGAPNRSIRVMLDAPSRRDVRLMTVTAMAWATPGSTPSAWVGKSVGRPWRPRTGQGHTRRGTRAFQAGGAGRRGCGKVPPAASGWSDQEIGGSSTRDRPAPVPEADGRGCLGGTDYPPAILTWPFRQERTNSRPTALRKSASRRRPRSPSSGPTTALTRRSGGGR